MRRRVDSAVLGVVLLAAATACGPTTYVDRSDPANAIMLGWHIVDPIDVDVPDEDPVRASDDGPVDESRPILVNLWASYCGPCRTELPLLEQVSRSGALQVVGLSRDVRRNAAVASLRDARVTYPNWRDADATFAVALDGRIPLAQLPSSALLVDGRVTAVHIGAFKNRAEVLAGLRFVEPR